MPAPPPGLSWQPLTLKFEGTLETKQDARISTPPDFDLLRDAHFEEIGALQTRPPFGTVMGGGAIFGGGSLVNCRKLAKVNGELCLFTDTGLYSWNAQQVAWVLRGTHLAVSVDETPRLVTSGDQIDGDRAELSGTIVVAWTEGGQVYAGAVDKTTGSVLVSPTAVSTAIGRPRLVALATKILLFVEASSTLLTVRAIDPASPSGGIGGAGTTILATNYNLYYDVVRAGTQDLVVGACRRQTTTSYTVFTVTPALSVVTATPTRTCDGPIAVSAIPDGTKTQIVRANGNSVQGDLITTSTLADVFTGQAIGSSVSGTGISQVTAAHQSVQQGGQFRCYVFWSDNESSAPEVSFGASTNWIDTGSSHGTAGPFVAFGGIASRAFDYNGRVFVWLAFGQASGSAGAGNLAVRATGQLQNAYFLHRDDGFLTAKATHSVGGGLAPSTGRLPAVAPTGAGTFAWAAARRRIIPLGVSSSTTGSIGSINTGYAARELVDVAIAFDSNGARRSTQLGATLYIAAGEILQYDGRQIVEVGFHVYPWSIFSDAAVGVGAVANGTYGYKATYRWDNAQSELDRSTVAVVSNATVTGGPLLIELLTRPNPYTHKTSPLAAIEWWRTAVNPGADAPYYLVSSLDPNATNPNGYITCLAPSDFSANPKLNDGESDATATGNQTNPENGGDLENLAPPAAKVIVPTETRLLLAGVAGDPDAWLYSRERGDGEIASFHDSLRVEVPPVGGAITALWADDQFVYVARQTAIYAYAGPGIGNDGTGQNFTLVRTISRDVGVVSQEAHTPTPVGRLIKTSKGWYVLDGGGGLRYVGGEVSDFDGDTVLAVHTITSKHQVRILTDQRLLVWDYRGLVATTSPGPGRWGEWTIAGGLDAILYNDVYTILTAAGPIQESASFSGLTYGLDVALAYIKPADLMGAVAVRRVMPLGEYRSAHLLRLRMYYNFDDSTVVDDVVWNPSPTVVGGPLQFAHGPKRRKCESFKVRLTACAAGLQATLATASGLSHAVSTSGTNWAATFAAKTGSMLVVGELGNKVTMSIAFTSGSPNVVDVRDHFSYDANTGLWSPDLNNVGVHITCAAGSLTVAALETAIAAATALIQVSAADATPSKTIDAVGMNGLAATGSFTGGTFTAPTGEALKLTGLGLEVGITSQGLFKRLPAAQKA